MITQAQKKSLIRKWNIIVLSNSPILSGMAGIMLGGGGLWCVWGSLYVVTCKAGCRGVGRVVFGNIVVATGGVDAPENKLGIFCGWGLILRSIYGSGRARDLPVSAAILGQDGCTIPVDPPRLPLGMGRPPCGSTVAAGSVSLWGLGLGGGWSVEQNCSTSVQGGHCAARLPSLGGVHHL